MKETIYTIPVNDAFSKDSECAICELEKELEIKNLDFSLGAALMEPSVRVEMNEKGFCRKHYKDLLNSKNNTLGLSLILTSHHEKIKEQTIVGNDNLFKKLRKENKKKNKFKFAQSIANDMVAKLSTDLERCFICDRINYTMEKYYDVIIYMWKKDEKFKRNFLQSKGFCNRHTVSLINHSKNSLSKKDFCEFIEELYSLYKINWERNEEDLRWFTKKFDYQYKKEPWKNSKDALPRFISKSAGYIKQEND